MSNLLKSKFLLGVMLVAVMFVGVAALGNAETASADCTITSTLRVGSVGVEVQCLQGIVGATADGKFGPLTKAAVMAWQAGHGLVADGVVGPLTRAALMGAPTGNFPAGCTSASGYSSTTGLPCNTGTSSGLPAGCSTTSGYSPLTGAKCDGSSTPSTPSDDGSDEGELKNFDQVAAADDSFSEGEEVELLAFEMEADGSDMEVSRIDIYMDETAGAGDSDNADDYFDSATLYIDGEEFADLDVSDWDEDNWGVVTGANGDEYRLRFEGEATVDEGDTAKVTVVFQAANNIDTGDETASWLLDLETDSVRAEDESGFSDEYGLSIEEATPVDGAETGDLDVSISSDNPEAQVVAVDATDDTDGVEVLAFDLEANDGDIDVETITVTIDDVGTLTDVDQVVNTLHLFMDGEEIASESVPATAGQTEAIAFDVEGEVMIEDGDTVEFTVEADINNLDGVDFDEGDGIVVSFTSVDAEDEAGDNVEADGTAAGENFYFYTVAPEVAKVSATITKSAGEAPGTEATDDTADGTIVFTVEAVGGTVYINGDNEGTAGDVGVQMDDGQGNALTALTDYSYTVTGSGVTTTNSGADEEYFTIPEGSVATFTLSFHLDPASTGFFGGNVTSVEFGTAATSSATRSASSLTVGTVADDLETALVQLTDGA